MASIDEMFQIGKWLEFDKGTLFGAEKNHEAIIVGIDEESRAIGVVVNATSQVDKVRAFIKSHQLSPYTIVEAQNENLHLMKKSVFNCNYAQLVTFDQMKGLAKKDLVRISAFNEDVSSELMNKLKLGIYESPMLPEKVKKMVKP